MCGYQPNKSNSASTERVVGLPRVVAFHRPCRRMRWRAPDDQFRKIDMKNSVGRKILVACPLFEAHGSLVAAAILSGEI